MLSPSPPHDPPPYLGEGHCPPPTAQEKQMVEPPSGPMPTAAPVWLYCPSPSMQGLLRLYSSQPRWRTGVGWAGPRRTLNRRALLGTAVGKGAECGATRQPHTSSSSGTAVLPPALSSGGAALRPEETLHERAGSSTAAPEVLQAWGHCTFCSSSVRYTINILLVQWTGPGCPTCTAAFYSNIGRSICVIVLSHGILLNEALEYLMSGQKIVFEVILH
ncbi:hypothetical protein KIL84_007952 [Mauremys mutica]|uniref:Uncharacterized protein n=1 Tax=Mauremys mutica TaxID=74926 RepID=A0A9D4AW45_9SAUR|nr:hypothetical protein KIL84_007952 [Mauremys mutica]